MIKAGIIGGTGYTGGELIRLLLNHPNAELSFVTSYSNVGKNNRFAPRFNRRNRFRIY